MPGEMKTMNHNNAEDKTMKAIVTTKYGAPDVLQYQEVDKPLPKKDEVLIKIHTASLTAADGMMRTGTPYFGRLFTGLTKPKNRIPGTGFAGEIIAVGKQVKRFHAGDRVFGENVDNFGTHAEYVCVAEEGVLLTIPDNIGFDDAAPLCDGALTAFSFLRDVANIQHGQRILIIGAAGGVGSSAVQLAKYFNADVTGVCGSANIELVKSLGADHIIDYSQDDFNNNGQLYDIIFDTVGKSSFCACKESLTKKGIYISTVLSLPLLFHTLLTSKNNGKRAKFSATGLRPKADLVLILEEIKNLIENGTIRSVIDKRYPLQKITEAHEYVGRGHKRGNVVIRMQECIDS
jgi:NADPH:quinone reductase-like Zn-dependent oxidoreductase